VLVAGVGAGCTFAAMPLLIVAVVRRDQTGSAIAVNQVLRVIGFAVGSALSASLLDVHAGGHVVPATAYTIAALLGAAIMALAAIIATAVGSSGHVASAPGVIAPAEI